VRTIDRPEDLIMTNSVDYEPQQEFPRVRRPLLCRLGWHTLAAWGPTHMICTRCTVTWHY
jgi:hypothetical protein